MSESKALVVKHDDIGIMELGKVLAQSGFFADSKDVSKAVVKVLAGRELGFGPIASMTGIYIIKGRPSLSANMMAQAVKRSDRYDYRVVELTPERCEILFTEHSKELGRSVFAKADATKAGTQNMVKFPRNMLFSRAMSNGVKWYCPDVFHTGVYTPEEMGAPVDGDGYVIEGAYIETTTAETTAKPTVPPTETPVETNGDTFASKSEAIAWAMDQGVFEHSKHAESSWTNMWRTHSPQGIAEASPHWREKIANKLADKELAEKPPIDDGAINRILSGDDPNPVEEL